MERVKGRYQESVRRRKLLRGVKQKSETRARMAFSSVVKNVAEFLIPANFICPLIEYEYAGSDCIWIRLFGIESSQRILV